MSSGRRRFSIPFAMSVCRTRLQRRLLLADSVAFLFVLASGIQAQETVGPTTTPLPNYPAPPENIMEATSSPLNPTPESNLHRAAVPENDAVLQLVHLEGHLRFTRLTVKFGEDIGIVDGSDVRTLRDLSSLGGQANLEESTRTRFQTYNTRIEARYDRSGKTFLSSEVDS